ncbi:hypothetical protein GCM10023201_41070 [Actinomycetospora corticicola]|uniref:5-methylcytosine-specific restriction endonuclease McrA n=1 Tax=Actinomycetospora corticicola TaxID=663602 RepID=A0A7Y9DWI0_9PSEU|nr:HNH endonuclease [Actinomycetospora corticicola]NYD36808.1 5-methylcytosine-specific restriction endonuclease McrA [Actinomycetospora corticicola]
MPRAPKRCARCTVQVVGVTYCPSCTQARQWEGAGHGAPRVVTALHARVVAEEPVCACGAPSTEAGHIVARALGGRDVRENLRGQCTRCNREQIITDRIAAQFSAPLTFE